MKEPITYRSSWRKAADDLYAVHKLCLEIVQAKCCVHPFSPTAMSHGELAGVNETLGLILRMEGLIAIGLGCSLDLFFSLVCSARSAPAGVAALEGRKDDVVDQARRALGTLGMCCHGVTCRRRVEDRDDSCALHYVRAILEISQPTAPAESGPGEERLWLPTDPSERNLLSQHLKEKTERTLAETIAYLTLRLAADQTPDDASLMIAYEKDGLFRRVLANRIYGRDLRALLSRLATADGREMRDENERLRALLAEIPEIIEHRASFERVQRDDRRKEGDMDISRAHGDMAHALSECARALRTKIATELPRATERGGEEDGSK